MPGKTDIPKREFIGGDRSLWMVILILCITSILVVYSSTASMAYRKLDGDTSYFLARQIKFVLFGLVVIFAFHHIDYKIYFRHAKQIFHVAVALMVLTFFTGETYNDAARWLRIPYTAFTFQPSDVLKIALTLRLAMQLASCQKFIDRIPILPSFSYAAWKKNPERNAYILHHTTLPLIGPIVVSCMLVVISNLSTAIIMGLACIIVLILGRVRWREIGRLIVLALVLFVLLVGVLKLLGVGRVDTWISRVETFVGVGEPQETAGGKKQEISDSEFQAHQAKIAVASGWLMGKGPGRSTQRSNLPHPYSDYAYAFIIEEYGFFGAVFILGCYLWIFYRAMVIFRKCKTAFPSIMVLGLSLMITLQALLHMCVSVDATPVTGQTLPIISLGGSSLIFTCVSLGMILGVSRQINYVEKMEKLEEQRRVITEEWQQVLEDERRIRENTGYPGVVWHEKDQNHR